MIMSARDGQHQERDRIGDIVAHACTCTHTRLLYWTLCFFISSEISSAVVSSVNS